VISRSAETTDVIAGDAEIDAADFDVGHLFGVNNGVADVLLGQGRLGDLALAHPVREGLADADDVEGAGGVDFPHHHAYF
jgi:hypothetical protein